MTSSFSLANCGDGEAPDVLQNHGMAGTLPAMGAQGQKRMPPHVSSAAVLTDAVGRRHAPAGEGARIVSLVPSITELLFDLGLGGNVVGRTAFCVHPRGSVRRAQSVGGTKQVDLDKLRRLEPTHVIVNIDETPRQLADDLAALGYDVVVTHPIAVHDNIVLYRLMGALFGRQEEAEALCRRFLAAYNAVEEVARFMPDQAVLYLIWKDPWMTVSPATYISRMLALIHWRTVPESASVRYPVVDLDDKTLAGCERVLFSSEPFPFKERHAEEFRRAHPAHAGKAALIDAQMVSWYGSRAIAGLDYLRRLASAGRPLPLG